MSLAAGNNTLHLHHRYRKSWRRVCAAVTKYKAAFVTMHTSGRNRLYRTKRNCQIVTMFVVSAVLLCILAGASVDGASAPVAPAPRFMPAPSQDRPLDSLDKLYAKLDDVINQLNIAEEAVANLESQQSLMKKFVDELLFITVTELKATNDRQNKSIEQIWDHLNEVIDDLDDLANTTSSAEATNTANSNAAINLSGQISAAKANDTSQTGAIAILNSLVKDLKVKLFTVIGNAFACFDNKVEIVARLLSGVSDFEKARMCENGEVTLPADDRRAEVLFQSCFASTPQVQFSIKGFDFDLDSRPPPPPSYSYGYLIQYREPNAIGVITNAIASKSGVTFEAVDLTFGDTRLRSVTIAYQACTIEPGTQLSGAHGHIPTTRPLTTTTTTPTTTTAD